MEDVGERRRLAKKKKNGKEIKVKENRQKQDHRDLLVVAKNRIWLGPDLIYWPNPSPLSASSLKNTTAGGSSTGNKNITILLLRVLFKIFSRFHYILLRNWFQTIYDRIQKACSSQRKWCIQKEKCHMVNTNWVGDGLKREGGGNFKRLD